MTQAIHNQHVNNLLTDDYYSQLIQLRNTIALACDQYFQHLLAPKVDLFLISQGVSSPMGKGSDSSPVEFQFGQEKVYLSDSAQFGMEPLVQNKFKMVYCYLPSFRNEDPDDSHLNQFYHCEAELRGSYSDAIGIAESLVKHLIKYALEAATTFAIENILQNQKILASITTKDFPKITFDEAIDLLDKNGKKELITFHDYGRNITRKGELAVLELITQNQTPIWITNYDIGTVPFYHKANPKDQNTALNADLIFPSLHGGFGGEILGLGQRQDQANELELTMQKHGIANIAAYHWYIELRKAPKYQATSGFGMGIERFLAAIMSKNNIGDVCLYPVRKNSHLFF